MTTNMDYHYVLFLDILGYSSIIDRASLSAPGTDQSIDNLRAAFLSAKEKFEAKSDYNIKQFSDSIILSAPFSSTEPLDFLNESAKLQSFMLSRSILKRGAISVGKHFQDDDFVASQAVIEAYKIEQKLAKFPRVVTTDNFLNLCFPDKRYGSAPLSSYIDGLVFVDFLRNVEDTSIFREKLLSIWVNSEYIEWSAKEKIYWLVEYWNNRHPELPISLPERFEFL